MRQSSPNRIQQSWVVDREVPMFVPRDGGMHLFIAGNQYSTFISDGWTLDNSRSLSKTLRLTTKCDGNVARGNVNESGRRAGRAVRCQCARALTHLRIRNVFDLRCGWKLRISSRPGPKASPSNLHPQSLPCLPSPPPYLVDAMVSDFNELWNKARTVADEAEPAQALAEVLSPEDGRWFISNLEPSEAELCIEILDHVNSGPP
jgi:hypothetical protein